MGTKPASPFLPMFETFRTELDEHHDRRERCMKASKDITAASKKIIFALQRTRDVKQPITPKIQKDSQQYWDTITKLYAGISRDLQGLDSYRYNRQITGGNQEFMEALTFQHYLETQELISYDESVKRLAQLGGEGGAVLLTPSDYILGVFDMVGELMRFSITAMATSGQLPTSKADQDVQMADADVEDSTLKLDVEDRDVLTDLRNLRIHLEALDASTDGAFGREISKKMGVMQVCVQKVENALYGLIVRGSERPKGWVPDLSTGPREEIEGY
ncbi:translin-associated factor [Venturia nashicola]|uniref:Translin-associated factor n=1 Tax=Venturia nashicola TaxID=86259 RepID=A0A4Z1PLN7_9PEZI|nr:translin-associated factor [Venturia nashicola]